MAEAPTTTEEWVQAVEGHARSLCDTVKAATEAGVPDGLLLPALVAVFREAGMLPDLGGLDFGDLIGAFRR